MSRFWIIVDIFAVIWGVLSVFAGDRWGMAIGIAGAIFLLKDIGRTKRRAAR